MTRPDPLYRLLTLLRWSAIAGIVAALAGGILDPRDWGDQITVAAWAFTTFLTATVARARVSP